MFLKFALFAVTLTAATWTPASMMKVKPVAAVTPSPDGRLAVWTESQALMEAGKSEMLVQIWLGKTDGSSRFQLTNGTKSATAPAWSPDGKTVYFLRAGQVHGIPIDGGEAEPATKLAGNVQSFSVSPNGKWIAFTARETDKDDEAAKREKRDFKVIGDNPNNAALYVQLLSGAAHRKAANGPWHVANFDWSPDSARLAFETHPTPGADDGPVSDLMELEVETGAVRPIAATKGSESSPRYSPDGKYIAFLHVAGEATRVLRGSRIALYTRANATLRDLPASYDESPSLTGWAKDSSKVYFSESRGTRSALYAAPVDGPIATVYTPPAGTSAGVTLNATGTHFGMVSQTPNEPAEAYILPVGANTPVRVSAANTAIPRTAIAETRLIKWKSSKDGREIEGLLTLPLNYEKGKKYPAILNIHGGPAGVFNEQFIGNAAIYPIAAFAEKGFAILRPNPRGSSAYGRTFRNSNVNDWGGGDYQDLMSGVDEIVKLGIADPDKLAVMGWSYGGYMTNWVITQTNRFKCAASGAGLSNMASMWGTNDIPGLIDEYFTGPWYDQPQRYENLSPLFHAKKVTTPTLFLHGEQDFRVPITQAYEMHNALQRRGVPTQMVAYPRTPHGPQEPKFLEDVMQRHLDWVDKYIQ